ncbi:hypothetical protein G5714_005124 [Onychostoma macrolepis]|uniref:Uncharacterized protein n=1 Tax=Onychostoma macrolepis TaxID=369639 RepID=A0A7J6D6N2_9TELE|nr:hypothetical protein G5714_005124 [Onychostoma macrolepis]
MFLSLARLAVCEGRRKSNGDAVPPRAHTAHRSHNTHYLYSDTAGKKVLKGSEVIKLSKADMLLYGHVPTHEDFRPVVCDACNKVIKPQDVLTHYGSWGIVEQ